MSHDQVKGTVKYFKSYKCTLLTYILHLRASLERQNNSPPPPPRKYKPYFRREFFGVKRGRLRPRFFISLMFVVKNLELHIFCQSITLRNSAFQIYGACMLGYKCFRLRYVIFTRKPALLRTEGSSHDRWTAVEYKETSNSA